MLVKYLLKFSLILLFSLFTKGFSIPEHLVVNTTLGMVKGVRVTDNDYYMFLGVPYAKVDANNPFGPSTPHPVYEDNIFEANVVTVCPQTDYGGEIDCLHLYIYVPYAALFQNLPVMVWIPGGGFLSGFGGPDDYEAKYLVRHNIIVVSMNYRLGPYGFMCLDDPKVPGNQGLKDQELALKWVKNNIEAFGGDVDNITLSGESAGSMSVDLQLLFNKEKLYNRVIMQSGTGLSPWIKYEPDLIAPLKIAAKLGFETDTIKEALQFLGTQNALLVVEAAADIGLEFYPCVEKDLNVDTFIPINPINAELPNRDISILIGSNDDETNYMYAHTDLSTVEERRFFENELEYWFDLGGDQDRIAKIVRTFYIGDRNITNDVKAEIADFLSDFLFHHPIERSINKYVKSGAEVFRYVFSYNGDRNLFKRIYNITFGGAAHADELGYMFDMSLFKNEPITTEDALMINRITMLWTNFIKYGNPTPDTSELLLKWIPVTEDTMTYLDLGTELEFKERPFRERSALWDLFDAAYGKLQRGYEDKKQL